MVIRPEDENGDILPVLTAGAMSRGAEAVAELSRARLDLLAGDWWENPEWGNAIVDLLKESRLTAADEQTLANYLADYIRETPGIERVRDVKSDVTGRTFSFSCRADTGEGSFELNYSI